MSDRPLSRRAQQRWSDDKQVRELGHDIGRIGLRKDLKVEGGLVIHEAACSHPQGPCNCEPLRLYPQPPTSTLKGHRP